MIHWSYLLLWKVNRSFCPPVTPKYPAAASQITTQRFTLIIHVWQMAQSYY